MDPGIQEIPDSKFQIPELEHVLKSGIWDREGFKVQNSRFQN
jgi:hypothetical protein